MNESTNSAVALSPPPGDQVALYPAAVPVHGDEHMTADVPITLIDPPSGWQLINVRELWRYRELLLSLTWRDVKVRYKQTVLGAAWAILQPLLMMVVFTYVFSRMAKVSSGAVPYPVFSFAGLLPWTFFSTAIVNSANSVVNSERLITKIYFPRLAIPFAAAGAALVDFVIAFSVLAVLMLWYHVVPGVQLLMVPLLVLILSLAALGVGTLLAALIVAYRDFKYILNFLVQLWLYATPSVYLDVHSGTSANMQILLWINPMVSVIDSFRAAVLGLPMHWNQLLVAAGFSIIAFMAGCFYFRKVEDSFADLI